MTPAVKLDRSREMKFTFQAFEALEEKRGIDVYALDCRRLTPKQIASLVWAGQLHTKDPLEYEEVTKRLPTNTGDMQKVLIAVLGALTEAYGRDEANAGKD